MHTKYSLPLLLLLAGNLPAQNLPVQTVTIFKNNKALLFKSGPVSTTDGVFSSHDLPAALFGTYWVNSSTGQIQSIFVTRDSVATPSENASIGAISALNKGKKVRVLTGSPDAPVAIEGVLADVVTKTSVKEYEEYSMLSYAGKGMLLIQSGNDWHYINEHQLLQLEFQEQPLLTVPSQTLKPRLDVIFKDKRARQELGLSYLTTGISWTPVYRLEMTEKDKGRLVLRAELVNDQEDLNDAELRLAVTTPSFTKAKYPSALLSFNEDAGISTENMMLLGGAPPNGSDSYRAFSFSDNNFQGTQSEDYYFYTIRPGKFPKYSRFQYPVFSEQVQLKHIYECSIEDVSPATARFSGAKAKDDYKVYHYVEFENKSKFPWTGGTVNILSTPTAKVVSNDPTSTALSDLDRSLSKYGGDLQPLSQAAMKHTPVNEKCHLSIALAPDINVTHLEADVERTQRVKKVLNLNYDLVKVEAQVAVTNHSSETIHLKIQRNMEGRPIASGENWTVTEPRVTLRINNFHTVFWEMDLKPGEEKQWTYSYDMYVGDVSAPGY
ncbi:MAG: DUF4139 domain-containing protein [Saprospiraceae bacterium]|nr:DUF4139 domain-containing protein [Saprospiraceae bacterium]